MLAAPHRWPPLSSPALRLASPPPPSPHTTHPLALCRSRRVTPSTASCRSRSGWSALRSGRRRRRSASECRPSHGSRGGKWLLAVVGGAGCLMLAPWLGRKFGMDLKLLQCCLHGQHSHGSRPVACLRKPASLQDLSGCTPACPLIAAGSGLRRRRRRPSGGRRRPSVRRRSASARRRRRPRRPRRRPSGQRRSARWVPRCMCCVDIRVCERSMAGWPRSVVGMLVHMTRDAAKLVAHTCHALPHPAHPTGGGEAV